MALRGASITATSAPDDAGLPPTPGSYRRRHPDDRVEVGSARCAAAICRTSSSPRSSASFSRARRSASRLWDLVEVLCDLGQRIGVALNHRELECDFLDVRCLLGRRGLVICGHRPPDSTASSAQRQDAARHTDAISRWKKTGARGLGSTRAPSAVRTKAGGAQCSGCLVVRDRVLSGGRDQLEDLRVLDDLVLAEFDIGIAA
jgi:hypothetical protein